MNILIPADSSTQPVGGSGNPPPSRWKRPIAASFLSLIVPGLGQLTNREPWKGLLVSVSLPFLAIIARLSRMLFSFKGLLGFVSVLSAWRIWICVDAFLGARRDTQSKPSFRHTPLRFTIVAGLSIAFAAFTSTDYFLDRVVHFRAFKVPSDSFCPTICDGERIAADMRAFLKSKPKRGDVVMFDFHSSNGPRFLKRVVGTEGDIVSEKDGSILVNGTPFLGPSAADTCGKPSNARLLGDAPRFNSVVVPPSSLFVAGDNSANSYDSRIEGFGFVKLNEVKGRPVYIYWSPYESRIGCPIK